MKTTEGLKPLLLTPADAALRLAASRTTVYKLMSAGGLQSMRIGRCRRIPVSALLDFVEASRAPSDVRWLTAWRRPGESSLTPEPFNSCPVIVSRTVESHFL